MPRKYELETIPIWDAFDAGSECPLCILDEQAELRYLEFYLGNSVMVPETRVEVNRTGFCRYHFERLWHAAENKHSLSLIAHTHLKDLIASIAGRQKALRTALNKGLSRRIGTLLEHLDDRLGSCMICDRLTYTLERYAFTIVYLWKTKEDFREAFRRSRGFCLHHVRGIVEMAREQLGGKELSAFLAELVDLQEKSFERVEKELLWYTQKFDFQNDSKPWGTSKDALQRALQKITGRIYRER